MTGLDNDPPSACGAPCYPAALWGVLGFVLLLANAVWRLTPLAVEPIARGQLAWWQAGLYVGWVGFMAYSEGYRGFHLQVAPRVTARGLHLARHPRPLHVVLAPMFCMGLVHATRRRLITSWTVLTGIVVLVLSVRQLPQPWRGIVDGGVVVGLAMGAASVVWFFALGLAGRTMPVPADIPDPE